MFAVVAVSVQVCVYADDAGEFGRQTDGADTADVVGAAAHRRGVRRRESQRLLD